MSHYFILLCKDIPKPIFGHQTFLSAHDTPNNRMLCIINLCHKHAIKPTFTYQIFMISCYQSISIFTACIKSKYNYCGLASMPPLMYKHIKCLFNHIQLLKLILIFSFFPFIWSEFRNLNKVPVDLSHISASWKTKTRIMWWGTRNVICSHSSLGTRRDIEVPDKAMDRRNSSLRICRTSFTPSSPCPKQIIYIQL